MAKPKNPALKTLHGKKAMLKALKANLGVVTSACLDVGIDRKTHYDWLRADAKYAQDVDDIQDVALDYVESKLYSLINQENPTAIIFYLKTKGKKRGYSEFPDSFNTEVRQIEEVTYVVMPAPNTQLNATNNHQ